MNILIIKQTSLGDVLHSTGHVRTIKKKYPGSKITLLTATTSEQIYRHNPWVDELILIDRYGVKENWWRRPVWAFTEMARVWNQVREKQYDLAFDLQGLAKSVIFLYGARAKRKFSKGKWLGIKGFRNKSLHAIKEMDEVLNMAGIEINDSSMELVTGPAEKIVIDKLLPAINPRNRPIVIMSPFSRWRSKDWPMENYLKTSKLLSDVCQVVFTGESDRRAEIDRQLGCSSTHSAINMAGKLSLLEFVELVSRAKLMLTGDSFPMHVAGARKLPVVALFGPTDESKVGPLGENDQIVRVDGCDKCDRQNCVRACLNRLPYLQVVQQIQEKLELYK